MSEFFVISKIMRTFATQKGANPAHLRAVWSEEGVQIRVLQDAKNNNK